MTISVGTRLGPYEILSPLGAGGMGEVYRAKDARVDRMVALKVLPEKFFEDSERRGRFEREAKLLASLNHPGIAVLYSFEEIPVSSLSPASQSTLHILVMELLEGEALRSALAGARVSTKKALEWARQMAQGLAAAHEKGIVHRDLKPENLFVTEDGHLKIFDFGLAKRTEQDQSDKTSALTEPKLTEPGVVMGTVGYMSPEQVRGLPVDHRSDLFSFGAILYELLSGKRAFKRDTASDTIAAILKEEPSELSESGRNVSPALDRVVSHCLEKSAEHRFQSARDIVFALSEASASTAASGAQLVTRPPGRRVLVSGVVVALLAVAVWYLLRRGSEMRAPAASTTVQGRKPTRIVVLPFENLGAPQDAYLAAGMTEEISSRLANLQGLAVISRTTAVGYDRKGKTIKQIGADLGVDFVLEGTVLSDRSAAGGGRMRIAPQLIQVADDTHVWADRYDRVLSDIFAIQSEVAENVVKAMGVKLIPREKAALKTASTNDIEAYELYLRGLEITRRGETLENLAGGLKMYQAAVDRDSSFPQALLQLARNHLYIRFIFADRSPEHLDKAKEAVDRLAAIGPDLAEAHIARGDYAYWGLGDYPRALEEFKAALVLQPSSTDTLEVTGYVLRRQGRLEEAADQLLKWLELDPRNPLALYQYGLTCVHLRRYSEADRS